MVEGAGFRTWVDGIGMKQEHWRQGGWGARGHPEAPTERQPRGVFLSYNLHSHNLASMSSIFISPLIALSLSVTWNPRTKVYHWAPVDSCL